MDIFLISTFLILAVIAVSIKLYSKNPATYIHIEAYLYPDTRIDKHLLMSHKGAKILNFLNFDNLKNKIVEIFRKLIPENLAKNQSNPPDLNTPNTHSKTSNFTENLIDDSEKTFKFEGEIAIPRRVYEGSSEKITLNVKPSSSNEFIEDLYASETIANKSEGEETSGQNLRSLRINESFIELEIYGAGIKIDGNKKLKESILSDSLSVDWKCHFPIAGKLSADIAFRFIKADEVLKLGEINNLINVIEPENFLKRHGALLTGMTGIASFFILIFLIVTKIGIL